MPYVIETHYAVGVKIRYIFLQKPSSPAAAWYFFTFFTKNVAHSATFFVKKIGNLPPCRRRIGPFIQANA
jgi:hypothetical protein